MSKNNNFNIGLDIGTSSVGYAMTDDDAYLLKYHKRSTFGAMVFTEAGTAEYRRMKRSIRRRLDRKEQRIDWLQALLEPDIAPLDSLFFIRMNESFLQGCEQTVESFYASLPKAVFEGEDRKELPTIYHIRAKLAACDNKADIRYVYLALHHIIKYRGHFLLEHLPQGQREANGEQLLRDILEQLCCDPGYDFVHDSTTLTDILACLRRQDLTPSKKSAQINALLKCGKRDKKAAAALAKLLCGQQASMEALFDCELPGSVKKLSLNDNIDEDEFAENMGSYGELFHTLLAFYRWQAFSTLVKDGKTISCMMVERYEKHKADLKALKAWMKRYCSREEQVAMLKDKTLKDNYPSYVNKGETHCNQEAFYKRVCALISAHPEGADCAAAFIEDMQKKNGFLPLQRINYNGIIPNQLHAQELASILEHQAKYHPSLRDNRDKIMSLCTFRLPYYVGPLNAASPFQTWLTRKQNGAVRPWNFDEMVDRLETANGFIRQLTGKCSYLPGKDVLPLHSLLYEEYLLWDELNRVCIDERLLDTKLKQRAMTELFLRRKHVTKKAFETWLKQESLYKGKSDLRIDGLHAEDAFGASLGTWIDFLQHGFTIDENSREKIENLIKWSTIFEDRKLLKEKILSAYPELKDSNQLNFVCRKRWTGWGRLSAELLDGILGKMDGQPVTIMDVLRDSGKNLMMILHDKELGFDRDIQNAQPFVTGPISFAEVQALQCSPALKRGVWQSVKIVQELIEHQGRLPHAIYIESTRSDDEKRKGKRTTPRLEQIKKLYASLNPSDVKKCAGELKQCEKNKLALSDKQYLYFLQLGKCLYSEKPLDFERLDKYQIDHILPQSYIKDDSIENRALVLLSENEAKRADLLLHEKIRSARGAWWRYLYEQGLIGRKKWKNLTRIVVTANEELGFINRQLTETSQIIQHVADLFRLHYPNVKVRLIRARLSSDLRETYQLPKLREYNDMHHAFDALLACTLGCFISKCMEWIYSPYARYFLKERLGKHQNSSSGIILGMFAHDQLDRDTGELLWDMHRHIEYLKAAWNYKDGFIVFKKFTSAGAFFDETRYSAGSKDAKFPLRKNLPVTRYGGFNSIKPAYLAAISYISGKKRCIELVSVPIYLADRIEKDASVLMDYLSGERGLRNVQIIRPKLMLNQLIEYEGNRLLLRSESEAWNGRELFLSDASVRKLWRIHKFSKEPESWNLSQEELYALYRELREKLESMYPLYAKGIGALLDNAEAIIRTLSIEAMGKLLRETLKIMQCNGMFAMYERSIPEIGLKDNKGRINGKKFGGNSIILIDQSSTGFYESRTKLWASEPF